MLHRTRGWVWACRGVALAAIAGLAVYLCVAGLSRAGAVAAPIGVVIALAALLAPYLLPVYQPPAAAAGPGPPDQAPPDAGGSVVIMADRGGVAAQQIGEVTVNVPRRDRAGAGGDAGA
jgi:hypothetical protein